MVQVHPDLRVQALVEQVREREIEQMVGRLRLVHRTTPARVFLLTNLPTALPVDRLTTWEGIMPSKMEQAIVAGRGVLPLSHAELARAHPDLWATAQGGRALAGPKGCPDSNKRSILECGHPFRRHPGELPPAGPAARQPAQAIIPGAVPCHDGVLALVPLLGAVEDVRVVETLHRPAAESIRRTAPPLDIPLTGLSPTIMIPVDAAFLIAGICSCAPPHAGGWTGNHRADARGCTLEPSARLASTAATSCRRSGIVSRHTQLYNTARWRARRRRHLRPTRSA